MMNGKKTEKLSSSNQNYLYENMQDPFFIEYLEVIRLVPCLGIDKDYIHLLAQKYQKVTGIFHKGSKYNNLLKLAPPIAYFTLWVRHIKINIHQLLQNSSLNQEKFVAFFFHITNFFKKCCSLKANRRIFMKKIKLENCRGGLIKMVESDFNLSFFGLESKKI